MQTSLIYDPLVASFALMMIAAVAAVLLGLAAYRGLSGWWLRAGAAVFLLAALVNPSLQREDRTALDDIVLLMVDRTASQDLSDRRAQVDAAVAGLRARVTARAATELKVVTLEDAPDDGGSRLMSSLANALANEARDRIAGVILLSDGQVHDFDAAPDVPAPMHLLLSGHAGDWDRRLSVPSAPAFAIIDETAILALRVDDQGLVPGDAGATTTLDIELNGGAVQRVQVPIGKTVNFPLVLQHAGRNIVRVSVAVQPGELTDRNNTAVVRINGVRDRLRVLLVSGKPHPGERTWRNLLKSDSAVDLVHFTILRPPDKQDNVPVNELSLIAFPTRELFLDKIDQFDLIIFDRYKRRGILPGIYMENVRRYVEDGGAVLVAAGPDYASADSLFRSPLGGILPGQPTARVVEQGFRPRISEIGQRHPVTEGLDALAPRADDGPGWGRWFRLVEVRETSGNTVMVGPDARPLLMLDRVGAGRIALLTSDHAWLWARGFEGGGPQLELLRRLAHWMMAEPELEEEALSATSDGQTMTITRRTLGEGSRDVEITDATGEMVIVPMVMVAPGRFIASFEAPDVGLYRLRESDAQTIIALGPSAPREFEATVATGDVLKAVVSATRGGVMALEAGLPALRDVRPGRPAAGRGWIGLTRRGAYVTEAVVVRSLVPVWLMLLVIAGLSIGAWVREGRS